MGRKSKQELGNRRVSTRRSGVDDFPGYGGMHLLGDPGMCPPNRFRHAENARFRGGSVESRDGMAAVAEALDEDDACVLSLADFQTHSRKIYGSFFGCPGYDSTPGFSLNWMDHEQQVPFSRGIYYSTLLTSLVMGVFDGRLYLGSDATLKRMALIIPDYGDEQSAISGVEQAEQISTFAGFTISCLMEFDGLLFIGLNGGAGASKIMTWDGLTIRTDLTGIDPPMRMCRWRDKLVIGYSTSGLSVRAVGSSPGTYTTVVGAIGTFDMVSYRDNLYVVSGDDTGVGTIWKYDGTTFASDHGVATSEIWSLAVFNGYLFFGWKKTSNNHGLVGRLDSAGTYVDSHKDLTAQTGIGPGTQIPRAMVAYRGSLAVGLNTSLAGSVVVLSPTVTTSGTYTLVTPAYVLSWKGTIDRLLVF